MESSIKKLNDEELYLFLQKTDERICRLEKKISELPESKTASEIEVESTTGKMQSEDNDALEFKIGEYVFAKAGVFVFLIGIIFLLLFPFKEINPAIPSLAGYSIAVILFITSGVINRFVPHVSSYLLVGSIFVLYFSTLKLYFFSSQPVISNLPLELLLLSLVFLINLFFSIKKKSGFMVGITLLMGYTTALVSNNNNIILSSIILLSLSGVFLAVKYDWKNLVIFSIITGYFTYLNWLINNPFITGTAQMKTVDVTYLLYPLVYILIFIAYYYKKTEHQEETELVAGSILNLLFGYGLFLISAINSEAFVLMNMAASLLFLIISVVFYLKIQSKFLTFIYAMTGYFALSAAIVSQFKIPASFILLCWQSLIVISMAIWFRSRFIVIANFSIYLLLIFLYIILNKGIDSASISFGIVSLLSARIMNWQKERLELKTEQMRNAYLLVGLFIIPYSLYHIVPEGFIAISWIAVSLIYYLLSKLLKTKKYRLMAVTTLAATVLYVFLQGISNAETTNKIISFLVLGVVLVLVSITYAYLKNKAVFRK